MATFYDSLYVALAEREGISVITADDRMANAFSGLDRIVRLRDLA
jgi:predicted nucleic acid-binding protein